MHCFRNSKDCNFDMEISFLTISYRGPLPSRIEVSSSVTGDRRSSIPLEIRRASMTEQPPSSLIIFQRHRTENGRTRCSSSVQNEKRPCETFVPLSVSRLGRETIKIQWGWSGRRRTSYVIRDSFLTQYETADGNNFQRTRIRGCTGCKRHRWGTQGETFAARARRNRKPI